jgi:hypothetical protein
MSAVCILTPVVIAAWPAISAAVTAAAASLGYQLVAEHHRPATAAVSERRVELEIPHSEIVTGTLGRTQSIRVAGDGVLLTFSRDARGRASVCVTGEGRSEDQLREVGEAFSQRVVQQYVYQRLMEEMSARGYNVVEEQVDEECGIRLKVRCWEN